MARILPERIETKRLVLRQPEPQDADAIFAAYGQDADVCRYLIWVPHASVEVTRAFVGACIAAKASENAFTYIVTTREDARVIGMLAVRRAAHTLNIGYVLARAHWGLGYMPEAAQALTALALQHAEVYRVEATCDVDNHASARVLEKCGFAREGRLARYIVHPNLSPAPRDCWMYARTR